MFMFEYKDIGWWYWLVTVVLLTYGVTVDSIGFIYAIAFTVFQLIHYIIREKNVSAFPIQVRFWYMVLLIIALPEQMQLLYWVPTVGTWAQVIFGYCAMARIVSLLPWNRSERFSYALVKKTFFMRPVRGNIQQGFAMAE